MPVQSVMESWYEALTSGRFNQAKRTLQRVSASTDPDAWDEVKRIGHCCLGVLCDLAVEAGVIPPPTMESGTDGDVVMAYLDEEGGRGNDSFLPEKVKEWAGLTWNNPTVDYQSEIPGEDRTYTRTAHLSDLNDEQNMSFAEIAELIKDNWIAKPDASLTPAR